MQGILSSKKIEEENRLGISIILQTVYVYVLLLNSFEWVIKQGNIVFFIRNKRHDSCCFMK